MEEEKPKSKRGFASMTPEQRKRIASMGGKKAHALGKAHRYTPEEAKIWGSKGGKEVFKRYGQVHFATIGHTGGKIGGAGRPK